MHLFFSNKVDLSQERSVVILRKRLRWKLSFVSWLIFLEETSFWALPMNAAY